MSTTSSAALTALVATQASAIFVPPAWSTAIVMYLNQCDPEAIFDAGMKWLENYDKLGSAQEAANNTNLPETEWSGDDRRAYDERIDEYRSQLTGSKQLAFAVGTSMTITGALLFLVVVCMCVIAAILVACAVYVAAAMAGVFTYPAALAQASSIAVECTSYLETVSGIVTKVAAGGAAVITAAMALDVAWQKAHGNDAALDDFAGGLRDASDNMIWGTLSRLERMIMVAGMKTGGPTLGKGDPGLRLPNPVPGRQRGFGAGGTVSGVAGGNLTDQIQKRVPDYNRRDEGLFDDPPDS